MKILFKWLFLLMMCAGGSGAFGQAGIDFNLNWRFQRIEDTLNNEMARPDYDDAAWRSLDLPHDWVIEGEFDSANYDTAPATGWIYGGGVGWYRKHFDIDLDNNQKAFVLFDGVYNNATVWINGQKLGFHPYGYSPFYYDLTPYLQSQDNVISVKVDHTRYADSRWYTGAGIYRKVELIVKEKVDTPIWGVVINTPDVSDDQAQVVVQTEIEATIAKKNKGILRTKVVSVDGREVAVDEKKFIVSKSVSQQLEQQLRVASPMLWSVDSPVLYTLIQEIEIAGELVSTETSEFGIRSIRFDADSGFFLNDKNMKIKGVCVHHDGGLTGTAVPIGVWRRRLETLKAAGCNAIRISHNPASEELLTLCDEMGFLVQDEFFDEWDNPKDKRWNMGERKVDFVTRGYTEHFQNWAKKDLTNVVKAHRNHPSVIQWSIGNEIEWTYPRMSGATGFFNNMNWSGNYFWSEPPFSLEQIRTQLDTLPRGKYDIGNTGSRLVQWTKDLDKTRPVIANCILPSASHETDYGKSLDIVGYSYRRVLYDYGHKNYPEKPIMGTENLAQYHEWKAVMERPWIAGTFLWTGIDYMGEIRALWPKKGTASGIIDYAGFTKPSYHMMKSLWNDEPHIHIATQALDKSINKIDPVSGRLVARDPDAWKTALWEWHPMNNHWNYNIGDTIAVEVYANLDSLELTLDDQSFGWRFLNEFEDHIYKWAVPYQPGVLKVSDGSQHTSINTASEVVAVTIQADKSNLITDGYDVTHIVAQLIDQQGNAVKHLDKLLRFKVTVDGHDILADERLPKDEAVINVLGVDNGSAYNVQKHQSNQLQSDKGRALLILQSGLKSGEVIIEVSGDGIESSSIRVEVSDESKKLNQNQ